MSRLSNKTFLKQIKDAVCTVDPQADVYLFGSRARGDHRQYSDWDFLILTQQPVTPSLKESIRNQLFYVELSSGKIISTIVRTRSEWDEYEVTDLYQNIREEGKRL